MPKAYASCVVAAPAETVWAHIRDFNALPVWHPGVADSTIEDAKPSDQVGCIRALRLQDGAAIREQLVAFSDLDRFYSYDFQETPFAVQNYLATLRVTPVTATPATASSNGGRSSIVLLSERTSGSTSSKERCSPAAWRH